jgi:hypothetical protein
MNVQTIAVRFIVDNSWRYEQNITETELKASVFQIEHAALIASAGRKAEIM